MDWDGVSAVAEVVGAIGVIVSLLYLAAQIRSGIKTTKDSAFRDAMAAVCEQLNTMAGGDNGAIILQGLGAFSDLEAREKYSFDSLMAGFITLVESSFISNDAELMSDETMENWSFVLRTRYIGYLGFQEWWRGSKKIYIQPFQDWMDRQIERSDSNLDYWGIL